MGRPGVLSSNPSPHPPCARSSLPRQRPASPGGGTAGEPHGSASAEQKHFKTPEQRYACGSPQVRGRGPLAEVSGPPEGPPAAGRRGQRPRMASRLRKQNPTSSARQDHDAQEPQGLFRGAGGEGLTRATHKAPFLRLFRTNEVFTTNMTPSRTLLRVVRKSLRTENAGGGRPGPA